MSPKSPPNIDVFDIANWFLAKAKSENKSLKHMKLQKLVYFAYGWYYAYFDQPPLFQEKILAWRHGPVVRELYDRYRHFGGSPITEDVTSIEFDLHVNVVLDNVWKAYEHYSDIHLSGITHRPGSPWFRAYESDEWFAVIAPESIRDYFKELLKKHDHA
jgi:uncharacterized phage-associated protein